MRNFAAAKNAVLMIDEAQNLSRSVLEQIRMLSNLETVREDVRRYVEHRLVMAGGEANGVFTAGSYALISGLSRGIPRRINAICDRALLIAYGRDLRTVDRRLVRAAIRDIGPGYLTEMDVRRRTVRILLMVLVAAALFLAVGYLFVKLLD